MNTKKGVYTYTGRNGKKHQVPIELVNSLSQLQIGDHIAVQRTVPVLNKKYWHHAIIEDIDTQKDEVHVFEYSNSAGGFLKDNGNHPKNPGKAKVQRGKYKFHVDSAYLIYHREYLNGEDVVCNAKSRLGERKYDLATNNCEHFATWCKTCISSSEQGKMVERWVRGVITIAAVIGLSLVYIKLKRS